MAFLFKPFKTNVESYKQLQVKSTYHTEAEEHCTSRGGLQKKKKSRRRIEKKEKQTHRSSENWQRLHTIIVGIYLLQMSLCDSKRRKGSAHSWGPLHFELAPDF